MMRKMFEYIRRCGWGCLLLLVAGCQRDEVAMAGAGEETFTLWCVPEFMNGVRTRATAEENKVDNYGVLIFKKTGGGTPAENILVKKAEVAGGSGLVSFSIAQSSGEHYLYAVANIDFDRLSENVSTEQNLLDIKGGNSQNYRPAPPFMMGSAKITLPQLNFVTFQTATGGTVSLKRNVAKIRLQLSVAADRFAPTGATFRYASNSGYAVESDASREPTDFFPDYDFNVPDLSKPVYVYEQRASVRDQDWKKQAFDFILYGYVNGWPAFYRIALPTPEGTFADIKRNVSYVVDIRDIRGPGYKTYEEAVVSPFSNDVMTVLTPDMEGLEDMQEIYTNGYYEMGLDASESHVYRSGDYEIPVTGIVTKVLDSSIKDTPCELIQSSVRAAFRLAPVAGSPGRYTLYYHKIGNQGDLPADLEGYHTVTLAFGTLRKKVRVKWYNGLVRSNNYFYKFQASNGQVEVQNWTPSNWCGLGSNRIYDAANYFGEIMNSTDENIFVHVRAGGASGEERKVHLIASDHVIQVILRKN